MLPGTLAAGQTQNCPVRKGGSLRSGSDGYIYAADEELGIGGLSAHDERARSFENDIDICERGLHFGATVPAPVDHLHIVVSGIGIGPSLRSSRRPKMLAIPGLNNRDSPRSVRCTRRTGPSGRRY